MSKICVFLRPGQVGKFTKISSSKIIKVSGRLGSHSQVSSKLADGPTKSGWMDQMGSSGLLQALETHVGQHDDERWLNQNAQQLRRILNGEFWLGKFKQPKSTAIHTYRMYWTFEGPGGFFFKFFASSPSKLPFSMKAVSSQGNDWQLPETRVVHMIHMICVYNHRIGWWENLQQSPINLMVKIPWFPVPIFPNKPIQSNFLQFSTYSVHIPWVSLKTHRDLSLGAPSPSSCPRLAELTSWAQPWCTMRYSQW